MKPKPETLRRLGQAAVQRAATTTFKAAPYAFSQSTRVYAAPTKRAALLPDHQRGPVSRLGGKVW